MARQQPKIGDPGAEQGPTILKVSRFDSENRLRLSGPGMRAFLNIADVWRMSEDERLKALGFPGRSTYFKWTKQARAGERLTLPVDTLLRISAILGIHKSLRIIFGDSEDETAWLRNPHDAPTFGGQPPIALVASGTQDGIMIVRRYLDAFRGGLFAAPSPSGDASPYADEDIVII